MKHTNIDSLKTLNSASTNLAFAWFMQTCSSEKWCNDMVNKRPFSSLEALREHASLQWQKVKVADYLQAFNGHPMIGDISTLREKYANTKVLACNEQSGTEGADDETLQRLQHTNKIYLDKHGFIFIICASGLSAQAMLDELEHRLPNSTDTEIANAANEQLKITLLRINKAFTSASAK